MATRKTTKKTARKGATKKAPVRSFEIVIDREGDPRIDFIVRSREGTSQHNTLRKAEIAAAIAANAAFQRGEKKVVVLNVAYGTGYTVRLTKTQATKLAKAAIGPTPEVIHGWTERMGAAQSSFRGSGLRLY